MGLGAFRVGAREQHQHVGAGTERAPRLDAVDHVAGRAVGAVGRRRGDLDAGDIAAEVGLGHRDSGHHLGGRQLRQPVLLLLLGAAFHEGAGEDLGSRDQRPADAQRAARLSSSVATTMAMYSPSPPSLYPPYSAGTLRPNTPISARPAMRSSGTSPLWRCTCSAIGADLVVGEGSERVLHHLEVAIEMPRSRSIGERADERRAAEPVEERVARR